MWKLLKMPPASRAADGAASLCGKTRVDGLGWMPPLPFWGWLVGGWVGGLVGWWGAGLVGGMEGATATDEGRQTTDDGGNCFHSMSWPPSSAPAASSAGRHFQKISFFIFRLHRELRFLIDLKCSLNRTLFMLLLISIVYI